MKLARADQDGNSRSAAGQTDRYPQPSPPRGTARSQHITLTIIRRSDTQKGFEVLPRRWTEQPQGSARAACGMAAEGVERSFGWMTRWRRLVRDYEQRIDVSKAMILVAMGGDMLRRTAHP